ncbi:hypothetical protein HMSSN139_14690 [Paenibacillus sp. HMSSN-139]|nr:hypothetical protein HMSSN139_14690 [Paenibacillus sp. HMSSN-139]
MRLYHFSEERDIREFVPRRIPSEPPSAPAMVWTIDEEHAPHYYFPRDCPRICLWCGEGTTASDRERFFGLSETSRIIAIEAGWYDRVRRGRIYRYRFESGPFQLQDVNAGYYTATEPVQAVAVDQIDDLVQTLVQEGIELRVTPSLWPMVDGVLNSTLSYSMIRMRNATPR